MFKNKVSPLSFSKSEIEFEYIGSGVVDIYYLYKENNERRKRNQKRILIVSINGKKKSITLYPLWIRNDSPYGPQQKYKIIEKITIEGGHIPAGISATKEYPVSKLPIDELIELSESLPKAFTKDLSYSIGLKKEYRFIIEAIEEFSSATELIISKTKKTRFAGDKVIVNFVEFEEMRKKMDRISHKVNNTAIMLKKLNATKLIGRNFNQRPDEKMFVNNTMKEKIIDVVNNTKALMDNDELLIDEFVNSVNKSIMQKNPEKIYTLRDNIELITLEEMVRKFKKMLNKRLNENKWQRFFENNQFILQQAFGYPTKYIQNQATLGGQGFSGSGEKITDFLLCNYYTNNIAIIEIKKPTTKLLNYQPYRSNIHSPSKELSGSINQILEQKNKLEQNINIKKIEDKLYDIQAYSIHCILIMGLLPNNENMLKSFELFRNNLRNVNIITFDELYKKLCQLLEVLQFTNNQSGKDLKI